MPVSAAVARTLVQAPGIHDEHRVLDVGAGDGGVAQPSMRGMVKVLVDCVVSALHAHDGTQLELLVERLATRLSLPVDHLAGLLAGDAAAVLGQRRLLWPFRDMRSGP